MELKRPAKAEMADIWARMRDKKGEKMRERVVAFHYEGILQDWEGKA